MSTPYPRYCKDCKWFRYVEFATYTMCENPLVNSFDPESLSSSTPGVRCALERAKNWFGSCGVKGKLWEAKENVKDFKEGVQSSDR